MKIQLDDLARALGLVSLAAGKRTTLPILSHVLLKTELTEMTLAANNLEIAISCTIPVTEGEEKAVTVPARLFADYVKTLTDEKVEMSVDEKRAALKIEADRGEATIKGLGGKDFPAFPEVKGETVVLSQAALEFLTERALIAVADDEARPVLTGVFTQFFGGFVRMVAADGFRLSKAGHVQDWVYEGHKSVLVPARAFSALNKLCAAYPEDVIEMTISEERVFFKVGDAVLAAQTIPGTFPDYEQIIPKTHEVQAVFEDVEEFYRAVKTVGLFSFTLALEIGDGKIAMKAINVDAGEGEAEVEAETEGSLEIGLNAKYLKDVLGVMKGGRPVEMLMTSRADPVLFKQGDNFSHVLMPMHVEK